MSFVFTSLLLIGLPLVAVPLIIHLIQVRRQRHIDWAAMEFLLASQKKHRKWIFLKQLLLLLLRMAAIAAVAFMLAQPLLKSRWAEWLGEGVTHHMVLLDDSYSMGDAGTGVSAYESAQRVLERIARQAADTGGPQRLTILRYSEAARLGAGSQPEVFRQLVDVDLADRLPTLLGGATTVSQTDSGPAEALAALARLPQPDAAETTLAYLVSDFRHRQWDASAALKARLVELSEFVNQFHFVRCVTELHDNLAITKLQPHFGLRASGVQMWMELSVTNYGRQSGSDITVQLKEDDQPRAGVTFATIAPGETVTERFRVAFPSAGPHTITATLPGDAVAVDNTRYFAADIPLDFPILVLDSSRQGRDAYLLSTALNPGGQVRTGWQVVVQPASYLRDNPDLGEFAAVVLLDVPPLDLSEVAALHAYVSSGGGLAIFTGDDSNPTFINDSLFNGGNGIFPVELTVPTQLMSAVGESTPDVAVGDHPLFRVFAGQRNSFLPLILVDFYYGVSLDWSATLGQNVRVLARLRNGDPLVMERLVGDGRCVAFLSRLAPQSPKLGRWANWTQNPVFPLLANELAGYLSSGRRSTTTLTVDQAIPIMMPAAEFLPQLVVRHPLAGEVAEATLTAERSDNLWNASWDKSGESGFYEVTKAPRSGEPIRTKYAVNVVPAEGDLSLMDLTLLEEMTAGLPVKIHAATEFAAESIEISGVALADAVLIALIAILVLEQLLAYFASYHPGRRPREVP